MVRNLLINIKMKWIKLKRNEEEDCPINHESFDTWLKNKVIEKQSSHRITMEAGK